MGKRAVERAVQYAKEREVFWRPIGKNQGIQFPLAESFAKLETAELMVQKAASLYDQGQPCGKEANISKYMAAEAACEAADRAIQAHGGYGYIKEYDVERYWREARLFSYCAYLTGDGAELRGRTRTWAAEVVLRREATHENRLYARHPRRPV